MVTWSSPVGLDKPPGGNGTGTVSIAPLSDFHVELAAREGPAAQVGHYPSCLPSWDSLEVLRKAHMGSMSGCIGTEGGSRHRAAVLGLGCAPPALLQGPCSCEAGLGETPLSVVFISAPCSRCPAKGEGWCESVAMATWKLQVTRWETADCECPTPPHKQGAKCVCSGWPGGPLQLGEPRREGTVPLPHLSPQLHRPHSRASDSSLVIAQATKVYPMQKPRH